MSSPGAPRVVAIGLDAAESTLIRRLIDSGDLPAMASVLQRGAWSRTLSPANYSSGAVWPTFFTGEGPQDHGQYSRWNWNPVTMRAEYTDKSRLTPFWQALVDEGASVGVLDVPFSPYRGLPDGFEVCEWGPHDRIMGAVRASPPQVARELREKFPAHPFADDLASPPHEFAGMADFLDECIEGARIKGDLAQHLVAEVRPDVSIVVFSEAHHAGHFLWHTVQPDLDVYADVPPETLPRRTLVDLYRELDRQVGRLVEAAGPGTEIVIFALHGIEPARGVPTAITPLLRELGMWHLAGSADRRRSALSALKSRIPDPIRDAYLRMVPLERRSRWGQASVLPSYDWSRTRAFELPLDTEAHVRVNLAGREAQGIVPPEDYKETCDVIEEALRALRTADGRIAVQGVVRPPRGSHPAGLPDLVVDWARAAYESPTRVGGVDHAPRPACRPAGTPTTASGSRRDPQPFLLGNRSPPRTCTG